MKRQRTAAIVTASLGLAALAATAVIAQDKFAVQVPDGLALSEFRGYEAWQVVSVSHPSGEGAMGGKETLNAILANPAMIEAYASGVPANGKPFPDGAKAAKVQYFAMKSAEAPFDVSIPAGLKDVAFMLKDGQRFPDSGGWGYGLFNYDEASDEFTPGGTGATCGATCHTIAKAKDFVFTTYQKR